jgi:hypothetical protein
MFSSYSMLDIVGLFEPPVSQIGSGHHDNVQAEHIKPKIQQRHLLRGSNKSYLIVNLYFN